MCLARCNLHGKEGRKNVKSDSRSSFAELGSHLSSGQGIEIT
jgi:hypothetical protein